MRSTRASIRAARGELHRERLRPSRATRYALRMRLRSCIRLLLAASLPLLAGCSAFGVRGGRYLVYDTASGERVELEDTLDRLARADVVFLGEEHDNDRGHDLQAWTFAALLERRSDVVLSMEQVESEVQPLLDAYLRGVIDEERFLAGSRPWPSYHEHYRPLVE